MGSTGSTTEDQETQILLRFLADRRTADGYAWVSLADVRSALGVDWQAAEAACRRLSHAGLAELMGGFPLRPTQDRFTLVRLTAKGERAAGRSHV